ncbi:MAG: trypsin-like peptidase domain-containing protein [Planctomycetes bacterium]|nr:trypsin-like peptidase domain-containing protein [Planctomycetota bacterium]
MSLFVSGVVVGRASTAGRTVVQQLDSDTSREVLTRVDDVSRAFVAAANVAKPAVVHIISTRLVRVVDPFEDFFSEWLDSPFFRRRRPRVGRQQSMGSGVIVDRRGYILTNAHVVQGASDIEVHLADGRSFEARLIGLGESADLAVLRIDDGDLPVLPMGDSEKLQVGQWVIAVGNPFGLEQTVTAGIVSAMGRAGIGVADEVRDFIQTDTPINPGNSGGPLVNLKGELVGINTAILSRSGGYQGIGFAIPVNFIKRKMEGVLPR